MVGDFIEVVEDEDGVEDRIWLVVLLLEVNRVNSFDVVVLIRCVQEFETTLLEGVTKDLLVVAIARKNNTVIVMIVTTLKVAILKLRFDKIERRDD